MSESVKANNPCVCCLCSVRFPPAVDVASRPRLDLDLNPAALARKQPPNSAISPFGALRNRASSARTGPAPVQKVYQAHSRRRRASGSSMIPACVESGRRKIRGVLGAGDFHPSVTDGRRRIGGMPAPLVRFPIETAAMRSRDFSVGVTTVLPQKEILVPQRPSLLPFTAFRRIRRYPLAPRLDWAGRAPGGSFDGFSSD